MICFFGGRADLWPPLQNAVDRLCRARRSSWPSCQDLQRPGPPHPGHAGPRRRLRGQPRQQVSPARIIRTGIAVAYLDRLSDCREPLQRAIQHGREGGAVTSAIEALFLLGQDAFHTGRWDEAQGWSTKAFSCATPTAITC